MPFKDPERRRAYQRERYRANPELAEKSRKRIRNWNRERYRTSPEYAERTRRAVSRQNKVYGKWWTDAKRVLGFNKCIACGYDAQDCNIHAHHVTKAEKKFGQATMHSQCPSAERLLLYIKELKKCIPLCTSCHNDIHATKSPKRQARVYAKLISATFPSTSSDSPEGSLPALSGYVELVSSE